MAFGCYHMEDSRQDAITLMERSGLSLGICWGGGEGGDRVMYAPPYPHIAISSVTSGQYGYSGQVPGWSQ